jgi:hypothetical protein
MFPLSLMIPFDKAKGQLNPPEFQSAARRREWRLLLLDPKRPRRCLLQSELLTLAEANRRKMDLEAEFPESKFHVYRDMASPYVPLHQLTAFVAQRSASSTS